MMNPSPMQNASGTVRGVVSLVAQSFAGAKTFLEKLTLAAGLFINGNLTGDTNYMVKMTATNPTLGAPWGSTIRMHHGVDGGYAVIDATNTYTTGKYVGLGAGTVNSRLFISDDTTSFIITKSPRADCDAGYAGKPPGNTNLVVINIATGDVTISQGQLNTANPNTWTKAQRGSVTALTSSAGSMAIDLAATNNFSHTLTENTTLAAPSNPTAGQSGNIVFTQHASSPKTLAYNSFWKFKGGTVPSLTATAGAVDVLTYYVCSAGFAVCNLITDVK